MGGGECEVLVLLLLDAGGLFGEEARDSLYEPFFALLPVLGFAVQQDLVFLLTGFGGYHAIVLLVGLVVEPHWTARRRKLQRAGVPGELEPLVCPGEQYRSIVFFVVDVVQQLDVFLALALFGVLSLVAA